MSLAHSTTLFVQIIDVCCALEIVAVFLAGTSAAAFAEFEMPRRQRFDSRGEAR
jgi:hypothetical protein